MGEQEFMQELAVLRMEKVPMQENCASCKNYLLKIGRLETTLAEATREHELVVDDCAELANLKLQLAHEVKQRTLQERACDSANAEKEEYKLKFEKLKTEHQKQQYSLVELEKKNVGLELQRASNAEVDKQRQDMCDNKSALLLKLEVKREKERSSSEEIQLRDASEEIKQQNDTSTATRFPFPPAEICQQARSIFKKLESSLDQADLNVSQRRTELQQVTRESNDLWKKKDGKHNL